MPSFILLLALVILAPLALAIIFPDVTEQIYRWAVMFRTVGGAIILVVTIGLFLSTGNITLIALGGVLAAYGVWKVVYDTNATGV
ncbi:hypothetical protein [Natronorubrum daqingense]|uniref:Uncharacterized protein n=1 Tax=Natronorubrum daqingense TaxID=588898 RepID=A0A1N7G6D2_9EURY|nr:hypothetical protein [Natronorubrum daqingense]APX98697.1 hypothetical protein BB347_18495 [Natronorubrum daqingense]SIS08064.1 hypothetical protein SAMN05421809_3762 [Natronorubrum daqingense]